MTIARLGLTVKVIGQGQRSISSADGRGNAVTRSVSLRSSITDSFSISANKQATVANTKIMLLSVIVNV